VNGLDHSLNRRLRGYYWGPIPWVPLLPEGEGPPY
jgi:hypothetical protein